MGTMSTVNTPVPTISVTPQSPAGINISSDNDHYSILDGNLKRLHQIVEVVQQIKDANVSALSTNSQILKLGDQNLRSTTSCPSLNECNSDFEYIGNSAASSHSRVDLSSSMSTPYISASSSSAIQKQRDCTAWKSKSSLNGGDISRRRSWAALEDLSVQGELDQKIGKQRSASLSSLESNTEDIFTDIDNENLATQQNMKNIVSKVHSDRRTSNAVSINSNISTHSLNDFDYLNDFDLRSLKDQTNNSSKSRSSLQKSISTPSIMGAPDLDPSLSFVAPEQSTETVDPNVTNGISYTPKTNVSTHGNDMASEDIYVIGGRYRLPLNVQLDMRKASTITYGICPISYTEQVEKQRRKRGSSLFFRKKKEKTKKINETHSWGSVPGGNSMNLVDCDCCIKSADPKLMKFCAGCQMTVHEKVCVQHVANQECLLKVKPKLSSKSLPAQNTAVKPQLRKNNNLGTLVPLQANTKKSFASATSTLCYSPWKRVANKLGVNPINEDKTDLHTNKHHTEEHMINFADDAPLVPQDFLEYEHIGPEDLDTDSYLGLHDEEPETWSLTVGKDILKKLKDKEIKRQEHIYEFVQTEKHHCLTLVLMQKIFVDGLIKNFQNMDLPRMFPRLAELTNIHLQFLRKLRTRQRKTPIVETISDILLEQFSGNDADQLKTFYGELCMKNPDALNMYKCYLAKNAAFAAFVKHCQNNPLLKKKGIPECNLFVTQRLTKYPLLIEPLIKTSKENKIEVEKLTKVLNLVKIILTDVNSQVTEKEKEDRKLEIYYKTDPKSSTNYGGVKFKKSDMLSNNRKLRFEGTAQLCLGRSKPQPVLVIILSDILLFLIESNNKYSFFTPDGKNGVVSLQKLLVRELAGNDSKSIFLISSTNADPAMYELKIQKPKEKQIWTDSIRLAVENCPEDELFPKKAMVSLARIQQIVESLRQKDVQQAIIYEEKIDLLIKLLASAGVDVEVDHSSFTSIVSEYLETDTIRQEVFAVFQKINELHNSLYNYGTNLSRSGSSVGERQSNVYVTPIIPKRAETFGGYDNQAAYKNFVVGVGRKLSQPFQKKSSTNDGETSNCLSPSSSSSPAGTPVLDSRKLDGAAKNVNLPMVNITVPQTSYASSQNCSVNSDRLNPFQEVSLPKVLQMSAEEQSFTVQLLCYVYKLSTIIYQLITTTDGLKAQLVLSGHEQKNLINSEKGNKPIYKHDNNSLEQLRNLQENFTHEKEQWQRKKEVEQKEMEEQWKELHKKQEQVRIAEKDVSNQREELYRKFDAVNSQGLANAANPLHSPTPPIAGNNPPSTIVSVAISPPPSILDPVSSSLPMGPALTEREQHWRKSRTESARWKVAPNTTQILPQHLISVANQHKVVTSTNPPVKQQLPLKLATKLGGSTSTSSSNVGGNHGGSGTSISSSNSFSGTLSSGAMKSPQQQPHQQMIPHKLCELSTSTSSSPGGGSNPGSVVAGLKCRRSGYERLDSTENLNAAGAVAAVPATFSPPSQSHSRTGSSPAMMQNTPVSSPSSGEKDGGRMNTYPKVPDKYRSSLGSKFNSENMMKNNCSEDEKIIFF